MSQTNLKAMSKQELIEYIKANRNNDELVARAIAESTSRPGWTKVSPDTPVEEALSQIPKHDQK